MPNYHVTISNMGTANSPCRQPIPLPEDARVVDLIPKLPRAGLRYVIHLGSVDGPVLESEQLLSEVIKVPTETEIFAGFAGWGADSLQEGIGLAPESESSAGPEAVIPHSDEVTSLMEYTNRDREDCLLALEMYSGDAHEASGHLLLGKPLIPRDVRPTTEKEGTVALENSLVTGEKELLIIEDQGLATDEEESPQSPTTTNSSNGYERDEGAITDDEDDFYDDDEEGQKGDPVPEDEGLVTEKEKGPVTEEEKPAPSTMEIDSAEDYDDLHFELLTPESACEEDIDGDHQVIPADENLMGLAYFIHDVVLALPEEVEIYVEDGCECNCSLAREIDQHGLFKEKLGYGNNQPKAFGVYGLNAVMVLYLDDPTLTALKDHINRRFDASSDKCVLYIGGDSEWSDTGELVHQKLPVASFCSKKRHEGGTPEVLSTSSGVVLDLHTSECPIAITPYNKGVEIKDLLLSSMSSEEDPIIYAVQRSVHGREGVASPTARDPDELFRYGRCWCVPGIPHTDKGVAILLSSLRVFSHKITLKNMSPHLRDGILHMFYSLTTFPPAVRTVYLLMVNEPLGFPARAALGHCIFHLIGRMFPAVPNFRRYESSHILLSYILDQAKTIQLSCGEKQLPYLSAATWIDLRNAYTGEPVVFAQQTGGGLVGKDYFRAQSSEGPVLWKNFQTLDKEETDSTLIRVALLSGGNMFETVGWKMDNLISAARQYSPYENMQRFASFDSTALSRLCTTTGLHPISPHGLQSHNAPCLTLDDAGLVAVYLGDRASASNAALFKPLLGAEDIMDKEVLMRRPTPLLNQRDERGVFRPFPDIVHGPDELLMFCLDFSSSMSCPFGVITEDECPDPDISTGHGDLQPSLQTEQDPNSNFLPSSQQAPSRLQVLKTFFDSFMDRLIQYNSVHRLRTLVGIVSVRDFPTLLEAPVLAAVCPRESVRSSAAASDTGTALWDGISHAAQALEKYAQQFPKSKKRIICISNGEDTGSHDQVHIVTTIISSHHIVVDSICLGTPKTKDLQTVSYLTQGFKFMPQTPEQLQAISEMEPLLNPLLRPTLKFEDTLQSLHINPKQAFDDAQAKAELDVIPKNQSPPDKEHAAEPDSMSSSSSAPDSDAMSTSPSPTDNDAS